MKEKSVKNTKEDLFISDREPAFKTKEKGRNGALAAVDTINTKLKILHLEDLNSDAALVEIQLRKTISDHEILVVDSRADYIASLENYSPDIILSDHSLPSFNSFEALKILKDSGKNIPFILVTATVSEEYAVDVMKEGADDYILKDRLQRLPAAMINALQKYKLEADREIFLKKLIANEADLAVKNKQLITYNKIVSHDLRTPISSILLITEIIDKVRNDSEREKLFGSLKNTALNLNQILNVLVDTAKIKETNFNPEPVSFKASFNEVYSSVEMMARQLTAEFKTDFTQCPSICFPKIYLDSIFLNLMTNSLKYHSPERSPVISIRTYEQNERCNLEYSDNGLGLDLTTTGKKLFELNQTFHKNKDSKGLGLFMIKTQIESEGGAIKAESNENKGLTFIIQFAPKKLC